MVQIDIRLEGDGSMADLLPELAHIGMGALFRVAALPGGTSSGLPSVALAIRLPDGRVVLAETTARLFVLAARAIAARYPELDADA
jgi:hypothetical protein